MRTIIYSTLLAVIALSSALVHGETIANVQRLYAFEVPDGWSRKGDKFAIIGPNKEELIETPFPPDDAASFLAAFSSGRSTLSFLSITGAISVKNTLENFEVQGGQWHGNITVLDGVCGRTKQLPCVVYQLTATEGNIYRVFYLVVLQEQYRLHREHYVSLLQSLQFPFNQNAK